MKWGQRVARPWVSHPGAAYAGPCCGLREQTSYSRCSLCPLHALSPSGRKPAVSPTLIVTTGESIGSSQVFFEHVPSCEHVCGLLDPPVWSSSLFHISFSRTLPFRISCLSLLAQIVLPGHSCLQLIYSPYMLSTNTTQRKPLQP